MITSPDEGVLCPEEMQNYIGCFNDADEDMRELVDTKAAEYREDSRVHAHHEPPSRPWNAATAITPTIEEMAAQKGTSEYVQAGLMLEGLEDLAERCTDDERRDLANQLRIFTDALEHWDDIVATVGKPLKA
jgi:hypothetical protein